MGTLRIFLFGGVRVFHGRCQSEIGLTRAVQGLLAYLLLHRQRVHPRDVLLEIFWGEHTEERARNCLNTALWRLRRVLEPDGVPRGTYLLTTPSGEVGFNARSNYWLDVAAFEARATQVLARPLSALGPSEIEELAAAEQLCTSDLLEGFYDDWALRERERLRCLRLNTLVGLMRYHKQRADYAQSLTFGERILALDPLREEIHRDMMRLYVESGQRALAIRQYESCRAILDAELGIAPMEETQALYAQIAPKAATPRMAAATPGADTLHQALRRLQEAIEDFDNARERLRCAARRVEQFPAAAGKAQVATVRGK